MPSFLFSVCKDYETVTVLSLESYESLHISFQLCAFVSAPSDNVPSTNFHHGVSARKSFSRDRNNAKAK